MGTFPDSWLREIEAAQELRTYLIRGKETPRVRYGDEREATEAAAGEMCGDCGVSPGQFHLPGCDGEQCPACGDQVLSCYCGIDVEDAGRKAEALLAAKKS